MEQKDENILKEPEILKQNPEKEHIKINKKHYNKISEELKTLFNQHIRETKENEIQVENLALLLI